MPGRIETLTGKLFLPFKDSSEILLTELKERFSITENPIKYGDLLYFPNYINQKNINPYWCRDQMLSPLLIYFDSISEAVNELKKIQRSWAPYNFNFFRRSSLIQEKLPYINLKTRQFPTAIHKSPIGLYTLIDSNKMIASANTTSFFPAGFIQFEENHIDPPSRAYLKLYEALTQMQILFGCDMPNKSSRCFEAGASPGGWTWVLVNLGCTVFAVDRAELDKSLMANKKVTFLSHDAFTLKKEEIGECDWVFSDVICYPERLYEWIHTWLDKGDDVNMICTIKMQGKIDWNIIEKFATIPQSYVVHLNANKHELTFLHCKKS